MTEKQLKTMATPLSLTLFLSFLTISSSLRYGDENNQSLLVYSENQRSNDQKSQRNNCSTLRPTRGLLITKQLEPGSNLVRFSCIFGYKLHGRSTTTCLSSGRWSSSQAYCTPVCLVPQLTEGLNIGKGQLYTDKLTFSCDAGFVLRGATESFCLDDGSWSKPPPVCSLPECTLPALTNGLRAVRTFLPNKEAFRFTCDNGYLLFGDPISTCVGNNTMSTSIPRCLRLACSMPSKTEGLSYRVTSVISRYELFLSRTPRIQTTIQYSCKSLYTLNGVSKSECLTTGRWSYPPPTCSLPVCSRPKATNGSSLIIKVQNISIGIALRFSCVEGYVLHGEEINVCISNEKWTSPFPNCSLSACSSPETTKELEVTRLQNEQVRFHCAPGYILHGVTTSTCLNDGTWSDPPPTCKLLACKEPTLTEGLNFTTRLSRARLAIIYLCASGYIMRGEPVSYCSVNNTWSHPPPNCSLPSICPEPILTEGLNFTRVLSQFSERIQFICARKYVLYGSKNSICLDNSTWSNPPPKCLLPERSMWKAWAPCSLTCGQKVQSRTRICRRGNITSKCNVLLVQERLCEADPCQRPDSGRRGSNNCAKRNNDTLLSLVFILITYVLAC